MRPPKPSLVDVGTVRDDGFVFDGWVWKGRWYPVWRDPEKAKRRSLGQANRNRASHLQRAYGLTISQVENQITLQNEMCAIKGCYRSITDSKACIDHDHETGAVRGILCHQCNVSLGLLRESVAILKGLILYLRLYKGSR